MQKNKLWIIVVLAAIIVLLAIGGAYLLGQNNKSTSMVAAPVESPSTISVSGEYDIQVPADVAYIDIGVETKDKEVKTAQENNAADINNVIAAVKELGLKDEDISTSNYSIYPQYDYQKNDDAQVIEYYVVNNMVKLKVKDLDILGQIIDIATEAGANRAYNIYFNADDTQDAQNEALEMAIKDALDRAELIAEAADVKVVGIKEITDQTYNSMGYYGAYNNMDMVYSKAESAGTSIMSGDVTISANVHILVEIANK